MREREREKQYAVIGLGRFGQSVVRHLAGYGLNILACDNSEEKLHSVADYATHVAQIDATDEDALKKLGIGNFDVVIMAMGADLQSSILATMTAKELGAKHIVVKVGGDRERRVFESLGITQIVIPEQEMGAKLAHRLARPNILDVLEDTQDYQITEMHPMPEWIGRSVKDSDIRQKHRTTLLAIIRGEQTIVPVMPEEVLQPEDKIIAFCEPQ